MAAYGFKYFSAIFPLSVFLILIASLFEEAIASFPAQSEDFSSTAVESLVITEARVQDLRAQNSILAVTIPLNSENVLASQIAVAFMREENRVAQNPTSSPVNKQSGSDKTPADQTPADQTPVSDPATDGTEPSANPGVLAPPTANPNEVVTIPKSSAIIVSFPAELTLDPKRQHNFPITLPLLQPIVDSDGQIVAPAKSLVSAQLKSMKGGDLIEVISMVVGGRVIPINSIGTLVPAQNKQEDVAALYNESQTTRLNQIATNLQNSSFLNGTYGSGNSYTPNIYDYLNLAVNFGTGLTAPVTKLPPPFSSISQGSVYIINLASSVTVPKRLVQTGIEIRKQLGEEGSIAPGQQ